jgi:hypothetical protein
MLVRKQSIKGHRAYEVDHVNHGSISGNQKQKSDLGNIGLFDVSGDELRTASDGG